MLTVFNVCELYKFNQVTKQLNISLNSVLMISTVKKNQKLSLELIIK